jgi:hypothetical protein
MVIPQLLVPALPNESTTLDTSLNAPEVAGVPVIAPVAPLSVSPVGRLPEMIEKPYGGVPPLATSDEEYACPAVPLGNEQLTEGVKVPEAAGTETEFVSNVTAPVRAKALPFNTAPVVSVMDARAIMVPLMLVCVPSVAELPTCQNTLEAWAPPINLIMLFSAAVISVLPI